MLEQAISAAMILFFSGAQMSNLTDTNNNCPFWPLLPMIYYMNLDDRSVVIPLHISS